MRIALLALSSLVILACSNDSTDNVPPPSSDVEIVSGASGQGALAFDPNPFTISLSAQSTVKWVNLDNVNHKITADDLSYSSGNIAMNSTYSHMYIATGTYPYHCAIHPTMVGTIEVTP
jgi:plastocyanin